MTRGRFWRAGWAVLVIAFLAGCARSPTGRVVLGEPVPSFELADLDGAVVRSAELADDRPVVLNFWATWCAPCRHEIPVLNAIHGKDEAAVISIALDEDGATSVGPFVERHEVSYPVLLGDAGLFARYGGRAIPYTLLLDRERRLVEVYRGRVSARRLERDLGRLAS